MIEPAKRETLKGRIGPPTSEADEEAEKMVETHTSGLNRKKLKIVRIFQNKEVTSTILRFQGKAIGCSSEISFYFTV